MSSYSTVIVGARSVRLYVTLADWTPKQRVGTS